VICPEPSELQELVRELHRQATPWLPAGLASRLAWGPAIQTGADQACPDQQEPLVLSTAKLNRIVAYSPGDFTITVAAGTPLVAVQQELAQQRQWLSLDWPWGSGLAGRGSGSLGGLVARGLAGGYRQRYLGVRDQLIGIGLLRADGTAARAGGKVVKNVAGYDLMRLLCGSWGSLALITEVTLRTQPLPPQRRSLWLQGPPAAADGPGPLAARFQPQPRAARLGPARRSPGPLGPAGGSGQHQWPHPGGAARLHPRQGRRHWHRSSGARSRGP
jgi:glycolate oxidase FAD binding subunit